MKRDKSGLAIMIGMPKPGKGMGRGGEEAMEESEEYSGGACDMALEDAYHAMKSGDMEGFKAAMRDALASYSDD